MFGTLDLLYLVSAIVILWVGIFLCAALYQVAGFFKRANKMIDTTLGKIEKVQEAIATLRENVDHAMQYAGWAAKGGEYIVGKFLDAKTKKGKKKKSEDED